MRMHQVHVDLFLRGRGIVAGGETQQRGRSSLAGGDVIMGTAPAGCRHETVQIDRMHNLYELAAIQALRIMPLVGAKSDFSRTGIDDLVSGGMTLIHMIIRKPALEG